MPKMSQDGFFLTPFLQFNYAFQMHNQSILPEIRRPQIKKLLEQNGFIRLLEAHNGLSGKIVEKAKVWNDLGQVQEFHGIWASGLTESASMGLPDIELFGLQSRLHIIRQMLVTTKKPVVVDGDTGGGLDHFLYMLDMFNREGISAMIIEDKVFPKNNSLDLRKSQVLENVEVFSNKIRLGKKHLGSEGCLIFARTEALIANCGLAEALLRAEAYINAGADGLVIHSRKNDPIEVLEFAEQYHHRFQKSAKPLIAIPTTYNQITEKELQESGFQVVIHANHMLRSALKSMQEVAQKILSHGRSFESEKDCVTLAELFNLVDGANMPSKS